MYPTLFGFIDTYSVLMLLGVVACFGYLELFWRKKGIKKKQMYAIEINGCISIVAGLVTAILTQNLYDFIEKGSAYKWTWAMTFYGGIIGGVICFLLVYFLYQRKKDGPFLHTALKIAPACITIAHGFGRVGCFFAGCCYGAETDAWYGIVLDGVKVIPTNLFEAIFLILLSLVLLFLAMKWETDYSLAIYAIVYGIFRFLIEYLRGDHRGSFIPGITPSQFWSILAIIGGLAYLGYLLFKKVKFNQKQEKIAE
ncbi:MAG: prolipoprotein diacylglyceryl transferase [Bacilli bacterium]|nr:prolipoprotein diacylglyceryl transferase [Bacilli bacterium]